MIRKEFWVLCGWGLIFLTGSLIYSFAEAKDPQGASGAVVIESDGIAARINNDIITQRELDLESLRLKLDKKEALKYLIPEHLIFQAACQDDVKISDEEVDKILKRKIAAVGSEETFKTTILEPFKISYSEYREKIRRQAIREKFIFKKLGAGGVGKLENSDYLIDTFVTPREIRQYYEKYQDKLKQEETIKTRQIILRFDTDYEKITKRATCESILNMLKTGTDFGELARQYSEVKTDLGGEWDWLPKGSFPEEVEKIIYQLKEGEISPLIETENSFRIIKVEGKKGGTNGFNDPELQEGIRRVLADQKINDGAERLVHELINKAQIWPLEALGTSGSK